MNLILAILQDIGKFLKDNWAAIGLAIVDYEESRVHGAEIMEKKAEADLAIEKANEQVDRDNAGKSDSDIVDAAIKGPDSGKT